MGDNIRGVAFVGVGGALQGKRIYITFIDVLFAGSKNKSIDS